MGLAGRSADGLGLAQRPFHLAVGALAWPLDHAYPTVAAPGAPYFLQSHHIYRIIPHTVVVVNVLVSRVYFDYQLINTPLKGESVIIIVINRINTVNNC